jgi:tetrahydromethanopterin S-methyltransferase subunit B
VEKKDIELVEMGKVQEQIKEMEKLIQEVEEKQK